MMMRLIRMLLPFLFKVTDRPNKTIDMTDEKKESKYDDFLYVTVKLDKSDKYIYQDCMIYAKTKVETLSRKSLATGSHLRSFLSDVFEVSFRVQLASHDNLWRIIGSHGELKKNFEEIITVNNKRIHFKLVYE